MILRSIELENFGRFRGRTIEFRRGMNLVIGHNEAGKSTIAAAVPAVLFGTDHLERFKPWGRNACSAVLFFEGQGRTVQVRRNLVTDEVELVEKDDLYHVRSEFSGKVPARGRSASCREYRDLLESLLGVGDESLFRATYFFGHQPQEWTGEELAQKLRALVGGGAETDYAQIIDELLDEHFQLTRSNPWGRDKQRDREYEEVCQQLAALKPGDGEEPVPVFVEIDNHEELRAEIESLAAELQADRDEFEKGRHYVERIRQNNPRRAEAGPTPVVDAAAASDSTAAEDKSTIADRLSAVGLPRNPPRELPQLLTEATEIRQELAGLQQPTAALNAREKKIHRVPWLMIGALVLIMIAGMSAAWWLNYHAMPISAFCAIGSLVLLGWGGWRQFTRNRASAECDNERQRLDAKRHQAQQRQAELSERCEAFGLPSSAIDLLRLQKLVTTHRELLENFWSGSAADHRGDEPVDDPQPAPVAKRSAEDANTDADADTRELQRLEERLSEFEMSLQEKERRLQKLQLQLEERTARQDAPETSRGPALLQRKHELNGRIAVLRKAITLLADAVEEFGCSHLTALNEEASRLLGKMTNGRYKALKLDDGMTPSILADGRRWMPVESFSRGTVDAIYLSLRVALAKVRGDGRSLPLMLDDPFVHLDHKRLTTAMNLVDLASADGQLILFSHNLELGKRAARERWHVVSLETDDSGTVDGEEGGDHAGQLHLL